MDIAGIGNDYIKSAVDSSINKASDDSFRQRLEKVMDQSSEKELKQACRDFEGMMLNILYKQMKATVPKSDLLPRDTGGDIFESMLDEQLVEEASKSGSAGLADVLYKQLSKQLGSVYKKSEEDDMGTIENK
ncbi:flagellar protein FlgJ [Anaerobacterium chartisolvens]|uniref:Flagellar protein FlgJ n=1 Tax=Anaerobacterium chartisolvens TaxID=1297424 RepID=A0A369AVZ9_9FIRM|nr:rod-binding protein [Anaerobacterium chartisolvens]RCX13235.1 flagellar protein FlgJ [Anaerobacterium chartisolvens]